MDTETYTGMADAQKYIEGRMRRGACFDAVEDEINEMPLSDEQKSVLWLLAWSYVSRRRQRSFARSFATAF